MKTLWKRAALATIAAAAIGCGGEVSGPPTTHELAAVELPDVGGCSEVARRGSSVTVQPVSGVTDLYIVKLAGRAVCIDSATGVQTAFGTRAYAASNPMPGDPGDPGSGTAASNPMPGDPGDPTSGTAASNPMPGDPGNAASNPMPGDNASGSTSSNHH